MPVIYQKFIHRYDLRNNREKLYMFGDNLKRSGFGGQAKEMRGEINAVGIVTKRYPSNHDSSFIRDEDFESIKPIIDEDFSKLEKHLRNGGTIVIPSDGIGTGLAKLYLSSPKLFKYIEDKIIDLEKIQ